MSPQWPMTPTAGRKRRLLELAAMPATAQAAGPSCLSVAVVGRGDLRAPPHPTPPPTRRRLTPADELGMGAQLALDQPEGAPAAPLTANTASRQLVPARAPPAPGSGSPGAQATAAAECSAPEPRPRDGPGSRSVPTVSGAQPRRSQRSALVAPAPADALPVAPAVAATAATPTPRVAHAPAGDDLSPGPSPPASQRQRARPTPARDAGGVSGSAGASGSAGGQRQRGTARASQRMGGRRQRGGRDGRANPRAHEQPGPPNTATCKKRFPVQIRTRLSF